MSQYFISVKWEGWNSDPGHLILRLHSSHHEIVTLFIFIHDCTWKATNQLLYYFSFGKCKITDWNNRMIKSRVANSDSQLITRCISAQLCGGGHTSVLVMPTAPSSAGETGVCLHLQPHRPGTRHWRSAHPLRSLGRGHGGTTGVASGKAGCLAWILSSLSFWKEPLP